MPVPSSPSFSRRSDYLSNSYGLGSTYISSPTYRPTSLDRNYIPSRNYGNSYNSNSGSYKKINTTYGSSYSTYTATLSRPPRPIDCTRSITKYESGNSGQSGGSTRFITVTRCSPVRSNLYTRTNLETAETSSRAYSRDRSEDTTLNRSRDSTSRGRDSGYASSTFASRERSNSRSYNTSLLDGAETSLTPTTSRFLRRNFDHTNTSPTKTTAPSLPSQRHHEVIVNGSNNEENNNQQNDTAEDNSNGNQKSVAELRRFYDSRGNSPELENSQNSSRGSSPPDTTNSNEINPPESSFDKPMDTSKSSGSIIYTRIDSDSITNNAISFESNSTDKTPTDKIHKSASNHVNGSATDTSSNSVINATVEPVRGLRHSAACIDENGGLAGLRNIGNTCFMNSVIQCLSNTKPLLDFLLADGYQSEINSSASNMKGALIKAFGDVIGELWKYNSNSKIINTTAFKGQIQRFAPRFMGFSQQDAQEFLRYLLEGLHEDVNRVTIRPKPLISEIDDRLSDSQKAIEAWKRYLRYDDSKIVDIFVGQLKSTLQCTVCKTTSVTFDPFWDLSMSIPSRSGDVKLQQCFDLFSKEEVLDGDEMPTCSQCKVRRKCTKSFSIHKFPKILVIHLKRFCPSLLRYRGKLTCSVDFPLKSLDLNAYAATRGQGCTYNLYGVANHSGTTYSGHYTAYCRHPFTGDWHEYNDSRVTLLPTRSSSIVTSEAYVLFYELSGHSSHL